MFSTLEPPTSRRRISSLRSRSSKPIWMLQPIQFPPVARQSHSPPLQPRPKPLNILSHIHHKHRQLNNRDTTDIALKIKQFRQQHFLPNGGSKNKDLQKVRLRKEERRPSQKLRAKSRTIDVVDSIVAQPWKYAEPRKTMNTTFMMLDYPEPDFSYL